MTTTISIERLLVYAHHGVMDQERTVGNWFEVSADLVYPAGEAAATDDLTLTLNYAEAIDEIRRIMAEPSKLLEHAAGRIRDGLCRRFPEIEGGRIKVSKLNPPCGVQVGAVAVTIEW